MLKTGALIISLVIGFWSTLPECDAADFTEEMNAILTRIPLVKDVVERFTTAPTSCALCDAISRQAVCKNVADPKTLQAWRAGGFDNPAVSACRVPGGESIGFTHRAKVDVALFRNTEWTRDEVEIDIAKAYKIFAQCGVQLELRLIEVTGPPSSHTSTGKTDVELVQFARSFASRVALQPNACTTVLLSKTGTQFKSAAFPEFLRSSTSQKNTAWLSRESVDKFVNDVDPSYSSMGHELFHLLANNGAHTKGEKNLMANSQYDFNGELTKRQCALIKKHHLAQPL